MKKILMILGACLTCIMMISTVTAVPQTNSKPVMDTIIKIEKSSDSISEKTSILDVHPNGIIDLIRQLILLIIQFISNLIDIIRDLIGIVSLIEYLINLISILINAIFSLIEAIFDLFNPSTT